MADDLGSPTTLAHLRDWARDPRSDLSPLSDTPYLLFEAGGAALAPKEQDAVVQWLRQVPCPTLLVGNTSRTRAIARACDVILASAADAAPLLANIVRAPLAATVLVQLLRMTEKLPLADALLAESLAYATLQSGREYARWLKAHRAPAPAQPTDGGPAVVVTRERSTLTLELNRPSIRNAINVEMRDALVEAFQLALADDGARTIRLSGRGKCFSVGGDLTEFGQVPDPATGHAVRSLALPARFLAPCADRVECHVHSACIGAGIELPAFARKLTCAPDAFFQLPELSFGLIPGAGGTVSLPRRIGRQRTAWMVLSGRRINAKTALEWGLVDAIVS